MPCCCDMVRQSAAAVARVGTHVQISKPAIAAVAASIRASHAARLVGPAAWDTRVHFRDTLRPELTLRYCLVLDALNFCFWPEPGLEYEHLATGLKACVEADPQVLSDDSLAGATPAMVQRLFGRECPVPLADERARFLAEIPEGLRRHGGQATGLVAAAQQSAAALVDLVVEAFPGFRDQAVYRGRQVFFYKRAQIFVADVWGAFGGAGPGAFHDVQRLTMFADYRVPAQLRTMGILHYATALAEAVDAGRELPAGGEAEVEIRAATVEAVELMRGALAPSLPGITSVTLDWWLWEAGEAGKDAQSPHHRTLVPYY
ncbi:hypothetical protein ACKKBG_A37555 [Auxenochlorella protothecoides x Auxenochlorella symbiontica]